MADNETPSDLEQEFSSAWDAMKGSGLEEAQQAPHHSPGGEGWNANSEWQDIPTVHECRSWTHLFQPIVDGIKTHDLRLDDRHYKKGDLIQLREYDIAEGTYTGREAMVRITYITGRGEGQNPCAVSSAVLHRDYVILSIALLGERNAG